MTASHLIDSCGAHLRNRNRSPN